MANRKVTAAELSNSSKRSKFGVKHDAQGRLDRTYKGILYHSKLEAVLAANLDIIGPFERQVRYELRAYGKKICNYVVDFVQGNVHYEAKGVMTEASRIKLRLFKAQFPMAVLKIVRGSGQSFTTEDFVG